MDYPLDALREVVGADAYVVAKRDTELPPLGGRAARWIEPEEPRHPLAGIVHALGLSRGRPVLVVAADMPLVTPDAAAAHRRDAAARRARRPCRAPAGRLQPLLRPLHAGRGAARCAARWTPGTSATEVVEQLGARIVDVEDERRSSTSTRPRTCSRSRPMLA